MSILLVLYIAVCLIFVILTHAIEMFFKTFVCVFNHQVIVSIMIQSSAVLTTIKMTAKQIVIQNLTTLNVFRQTGTDNKLSSLRQC